MDRERSVERPPCRGVIRFRLLAWIVRLIRWLGVFAAWQSLRLPSHPNGLDDVVLEDSAYALSGRFGERLERRRGHDGPPPSIRSCSPPVRTKKLRDARRTSRSISR